MTTTPDAPHTHLATTPKRATLRMLFRVDDTTARSVLIVPVGLPRASDTILMADISRYPATVDVGQLYMADEDGANPVLYTPGPDATAIIEAAITTLAHATNTTRTQAAAMFASYASATVEM